MAPAEPAGQELVEFDAGGPGGPLTLPMTWGQLSIRSSIEWLGPDAHYFNIPSLLPVPRGATLTDVVRAVRTVMERHQGLRTRYVTKVGPEQEVHAAGGMPLPVWEAPPGEVAAFADTVLRDLAAVTFSEREWGWRCAVVTEQGVPRRLAVVLNHQAADGWAGRLVTDQLTRALRARAGAGAAEPAWQPRDQVAYERTGEGARRSELSLRAWQRELLAVPRSMFDFPTRPPATPRFQKLAMDSRAVALAARLVAERARVTTSAVLLTASAAVLSAFTGHRQVVMQLIVANRFDAARRSLVAPMAQDGLFVLDLEGASLDQAARRTYRSALATYRYGFYDPAAIAGLRRDWASRRGGHLDLSGYFNDARFQDRWEPAPHAAPSPEGLRKLTTATTVEVIGGWARQDTKFFVSTTFAPGTCRLNLMTDTAFVPPDQTRAMLRAVEGLLVQAAFTDLDPFPVIGSLPPAPVARGAEWVRCCHDWVDLPATRAVLRAALRDAKLGLFAEPATAAAAGTTPDAAPGEDGSKLVAYLAAPEPVSPAELHATCLTAIGSRTDVLTPHEYVVCAGAPADPADLAGWRARPVLARGSGRPPGVSSGAER